MVKSKDINDNREPGCWAVLADRKYYQVGKSCIKRTLRPHEWFTVGDGITVVPPTTFPQRWRTDAAIVQYLGDKTAIPLAPVQCLFEDDGAFYHCTEYVPGVNMAELSDDDKRVVEVELLNHLATLRSLRSDTPGVPGEQLLCPPLRVHRQSWKQNSCWRPRKQIINKEAYVFCHNDLSQHNILVDPQTLKINAIIDWEFGGFWPEWFERPFWERLGPSAALDAEEDDVERCRQWLLDNCDEVVMPRLLGLNEKLKHDSDKTLT